MRTIVQLSLAVLIAILPISPVARVTEEVKPSYSEQDVAELARIIYYEARSEDETGQLLVANVILNRVASSKYPNTIYAVIHQRGQFQPTEMSGYYNRTIPQKYYDIARDALEGETAACCDNVIFFNALGSASYMRESFWHQRHIFGHGAGGCTAHRSAQAPPVDEEITETLPHIDALNQTK